MQDRIPKANAPADSSLNSDHHPRLVAGMTSCNQRIMQSTLTTPFGHLLFTTNGNALTSLVISASPPLPAPEDRSPLITHIQSELRRWFEKPHSDFSILLNPQGTAFQLRVWHALQHIPLGETRTYRDLATLLGTSARAIGNACRANPIALIIPCHRVVAKNGLGGYNGATSGEKIAIKLALLRHEGYNGGCLALRPID